MIRNGGKKSFQISNATAPLSRPTWGGSRFARLLLLNDEQRGQIKIRAIITFLVTGEEQLSHGSICPEDGSAGQRLIYRVRVSTNSGACLDEEVAGTFSMPFVLIFFTCT